MHATKLDHTTLRWALLAILALAALRPTGLAAAQEPTATDARIQQARVQIFPEFDDPRVLVIVQGTLAAQGLTFPHEVTFRVPRGAQINQMALLDVATSAPVPQPFDTAPDPADERWTLATYRLSHSHFFFEYYYDPIVGSPDKTIAFVFNSPLPIDALDLEVQQPLKATDFVLAPIATVAEAGSDRWGFTYHRLDFGALEADQDATWQIAYSKTDPNPSVTREEVRQAEAEGGGEPALPPASTVPVGTTPAAETPAWIAPLGVAVLVVAAGAVWWLGRRSPARRVPAYARATVRPSRRSGVPEDRMTAGNRHAATERAAGGGSAAARRPAAVGRSRRPAGTDGIARTPPADLPPAASPPTTDSTAPLAPDEWAIRFCSQCGTRLIPGAPFCHRCGASTTPPAESELDATPQSDGAQSGNTRRPGRHWPTRARRPGDR